MKKIDTWDWNIHDANKIASGKLLRYVIYETFAMNGLLTAFQVSIDPYCSVEVVDRSDLD